MLDSVKISTSRKIASKDRDPSSVMVSRMRICEREFTREIYFRLLIRLLLSQHTDVRLNALYHTVSIIG